MEKEIEKIQIILENIDTNLHDMDYYAEELYKLHLQSQIDLLGTVIEHPNKPNYKRHDVIDKIKQLKKQLYKKQQI